MLSEIIQTEKDKYYEVSLIRGSFLKSQTLRNREQKNSARSYGVGEIGRG